MKKKKIINVRTSIITGAVALATLITIGLNKCSNGNDFTPSEKPSHTEFISESPSASESQGIESLNPEPSDSRGEEEVDPEVTSTPSELPSETQKPSTSPSTSETPSSTPNQTKPGETSSAKPTESQNPSTRPSASETPGGITYPFEYPGIGEIYIPGESLNPWETPTPSELPSETPAPSESVHNHEFIEGKISIKDNNNGTHSTIRIDTCSCGETKEVVLATENCNTKNYDKNSQSDVCSICGHKQAHTHDYNEVTTIKDNNNGTHSTIKTSICSKCGDKQEKSTTVNCTYTYDKNTKQDICSVCGHSKAHEHNFGKETLIGNYYVSTCSICGEEKKRPYNPPIEEHEHNWTEWTTTKEPTCTTPGEKTRRCLASGCTILIEKREIPALGHKFGKETLIENYYVSICSICGEEKKRPYNPPVGHEHSWVEGKPAYKDNEDGTHSLVRIDHCSCGQTQEVVLSTNEHTYDNGVINGDKITYTCTACGSTKVEDYHPSHEHDFKPGSVIRTINNGDGTHSDVRLDKCSCGETKETVLTPESHSYTKDPNTYTSNGNGTHTVHSSESCRCGEKRDTTPTNNIQNCDLKITSSNDSEIIFTCNLCQGTVTEKKEHTHVEDISKRVTGAPLDSSMCRHVKIYCSCGELMDEYDIPHDYDMSNVKTNFDGSKWAYCTRGCGLIQISGPTNTNTQSTSTEKLDEQSKTSTEQPKTEETTTNGISIGDVPPEDVALANIIKAQASAKDAIAKKGEEQLLEILASDADDNLKDEVVSWLIEDMDNAYSEIDAQADMALNNLIKGEGVNDTLNPMILTRTK